MRRFVFRVCPADREPFERTREPADDGEAAGYGRQLPSDWPDGAVEILQDGILVDRLRPGA